MNDTLIPTQLFVGSKDILDYETELFLQQQFCSKNKDKNCYCNDCRKIKIKQHENIIFINPEKDYSVKDVAIIFEQTSLSLDKNQKFFFILQKAQTLNTATANKLLKILEEPPIGYNFILQTNNKNSTLPTISSRCLIKIFKESIDTQSNHPIVAFFYEQDLDNPINFDKQLKESNLSDSESIELINNMLNFYSQKIILCSKNNNLSEINYNLKVFNFLKKTLKKEPMSGSSKIFWKNLYIQFPRK
ncbi:hypothetical protein KJ644_02020 [Candidatus Dependentiae bacterium]|nr:hypothetical protein [Candidatus Dependentiae bacterium]MBU4387229.1 hypothetical protein [Candidatus Dependentiae bacterium]MCG2756145.1 hypothetical protein [Candidatus Dependentiae bacterium]